MNERFRVRIMGVDELLAALPTSQGADVISIVGTPGGTTHPSVLSKIDDALHAFRLRTGANILRLVFDDVTVASQKYKPPEFSHVLKAAGWATSIKRGGEVIIHCAAGISRSTAIATVALMATGTDPLRALGTVFDARPQAEPNPRILQLAEQLYKLPPGKLTKAAEFLVSQRSDR